MTDAPAPNRFRIISLDGGGIRGIITAVWLERLESKLNGRVKDYCDLVAGTSTGSILACAIAAGIPAADIVQMYHLYGREIFPNKTARFWDRAGRLLTQGISAPRYNDIGLARVLQRVFGNRTFGSLGQQPLVIVTSYNTLTRSAVVFKSNRAAHQILPVWEVAKASSSAPTYFPAHVATIDKARTPLIDGGVVANNPTLCAIAEAIRLAEDDKRPTDLKSVIVGSFGTGQTSRSIGIAEAREWGAIEWVAPLIDVLLDGPADAVDYIAQRLLEKTHYLRLQAPLNKAYDDMDNADQTNINALVNVANDYLDTSDGGAKLDNLTNLLK